MKTTTPQTTRIAGLRQMLLDRRHAMQTDVKARIHQSRSDRPREGRDPIDQCDLAIEKELSFAVLQMRTEALVGVEIALARLDAGQYGACCECGAEIAASRLRALPSAVRCRGCEETMERGSLAVCIPGQQPGPRAL